MITSEHQFEKKITPYLDGSLSQEEVSEFEAFVLTHPEFEAKIKSKKDEIQLIKKMIPEVFLSRETSQTIQNEMKASVFNLLRQEPKTLTDKFKMKWEEWINR